MQDEMSITVIAAGFVGMDDNNTVEEAPVEAAPVQQAAQPQNSAIDDYTSLLEIFGR